MDRYEHDSPTREAYDDGYERNGTDRSSKHRSKDRKDKDHRDKDRERSKRSGDDVAKEREKETKGLEKERDKHRDKDRNKDSKVREKDYDREKYREKERERDRKDRGKEKQREKEKEREGDKERGKEKGRDQDREKEKEREKTKEKDRGKETEKHKDQEKDREDNHDRDRQKSREKTREKEREMDQETDRLKDRERVTKKSGEEDRDKGEEDKLKFIDDHNRDKDIAKPGKVSFRDKDGTARAHVAASELEERIVRMREEREKKRAEGASEILSWVNKSRKLEEKKNDEKEKALQLSKVFEEQDNIGQEETEDEEGSEQNSGSLAGAKVLHGLDKLMEGGSVVLTLKDQSILANGDINEDADMLENVEIGEQKRRNDAYKAAKKKTGIHEDKFNDDISLEKKILPQYDDPAEDEGLVLDGRGRFTAEAEKKLEELRRRIQGGSTSNQFEDLNSAAKISSDYYTTEEMLQFKKPKKKKSLRKRDKLDIDALEAEAVATGLGVGDIGSRNDGRRQAIKEELERSEAEMRSTAYQAAYAKADEASKSLRMEQTLPSKPEEDENPVYADDDEDLYKSLERARKLALKKQEEAASGPQAVAHRASTVISQSADDQIVTKDESQENRIVFTEMEEFVWGLQLDEDTRKPDSEDVFMEEDEDPKASDQEGEDEAGGWTEALQDSIMDEMPANNNTEEIIPDETIHEVAVGKGLSGVLKLLKERGTLKETVEWGGRNMDKKKSKLVGIVDDAGNEKFKDIRLERTDEFGRVLTPKEAFRLLSHKFHGKGPGKMKQEKRMKQYQEELKLKQMKNSDTPSLSVARMREAQAQLKTPYLVLSGHVKPGQTSDPSSGFATIEKDLPGGLTPMLGDRKVEHFLGIKRKAEPENSSTPKKPKT
ncbi:SART-1 family protein DOT2 [Tripterygium wilfordii]|uniref:SART-1 family protein DOT2 n=1 Tax=Tripterygium wilfordii TaxID=458696 RepID=A0A7J7BUY7_TRIWF|nr:SART-1 family protein DOT2 [Tripterygium wilfordii]KAF5725664.1 SART-1 family protein DOT2 [Tripterygium wilfordii]